MIFEKTQIIVESIRGVLRGYKYYQHSVRKYMDRYEECYEV